MDTRIQAFPLRRSHPALLDEDILFVENLRPEFFSALEVLHPGEELVLYPFDLLTLARYARFDRLQSLVLRRKFHGEIRPVDREGADLRGTLLDPGLGTPVVHVDPLDRLEVLVPVGVQPLDGFLADLDPAPRLLEPSDEFKILGTALLVDLFLGRTLAPACRFKACAESLGLAGDAAHRRLVVEHQVVKGADLLLLLPDERRTPALFEAFQFSLQPPVLHRLLTLVLERIKPCHQFREKDLFALDPFPHHLEFRERLFALMVELGDTRDLIDDFAPFAVAHLHDAGDIALHHDVIALRFDPEFRKELDDLALLTEAVV
ncbi:hypothetical protein DSECCO2_640730 [anaerobic digester metagenome]